MTSFEKMVNELYDGVFKSDSYLNAFNKKSDWYKVRRERTSYMPQPAFYKTDYKQAYFFIEGRTRNADATLKRLNAIINEANIVINDPITYDKHLYEGAYKNIKIEIFSDIYKSSDGDPFFELYIKCKGRKLKASKFEHNEYKDIKVGTILDGMFFANVVRIEEKCTYINFFGKSVYLENRYKFRHIFFEDITMRYYIDYNKDAGTYTIRNKKFRNKDYNILY